MRGVAQLGPYEATKELDGSKNLKLHEPLGGKYSGIATFCSN